jgi:FlaA1/EpsC-like NDP-sugar epimerase
LGKSERNFQKEISNRGFTRAKPIVLDSKSISKQLKDKTILVTGAAGSIGSEIVRQVLRFNSKRIIVRSSGPLHHLFLEMTALIKTKIQFVVADIR